MNGISIVIEKSARRLRAFSGEKCLLEARAALGFGAEDGPKRREGDGRTPEGRYYVCTRNERSKFFRALGLSYPNEQDALAAFREGMISQREWDSISQRIQNGQRPDWDTALGGFIMIHGEHPEGRKGDWTAGCIAIENGQMQKLFDLAHLGCPVRILP